MTTETTKTKLPFKIKDDYRLDLWKATFVYLYDNPGCEEADITSSIFAPADMDHRATTWVLNKLRLAGMTTQTQRDGQKVWACYGSPEPYSRQTALAKFDSLFGKVKMFKVKPAPKPKTTKEIVEEGAKHVIASHGSDRLKKQFGLTE